MNKKVVVTSINLPVQCIKSIININDSRVEMPIKEALNLFAGPKDKNSDDFKIKSMNTIINVPFEYKNQRVIPFEAIDVKNDVFSIINIQKNHIIKTNDIKFFKIKFTFANENVKEFIVPSFVKFYSSRIGLFVPAEFIKSRHILLDYTGNMVKATDAELVENFVMTDYYSIKTAYELDDSDENNELSCNFYLNGILANISYNNFKMKDDSELIDE